MMVHEFSSTPPPKLRLSSCVVKPEFLIVGNLTDGPLVLDPKIPIGYVQLLLVDDLSAVAACGSLQDMGLPDTEVLSIVPALGEGLAPNNNAAALALIEEYADLFSTGPRDFGLLKGTQHQLELKTLSPFVLSRIASPKWKKRRSLSN